MELMEINMKKTNSINSGQRVKRSSKKKYNDPLTLAKCSSSFLNTHAFLNRNLKMTFHFLPIRGER